MDLFVNEGSERPKISKNHGTRFTSSQYSVLKEHLAFVCSYPGYGLGLCGRKKLLPEIHRSADTDHEHVSCHCLGLLDGAPVVESWARFRDGTCECDYGVRLGDLVR